MISQFKQTQAIAAGLGTRAVPTWLPAPPVKRAVPAVKTRPSAKAISSIWITHEGDSLGEKLMLTALVFAAIAGIGYGFSGLLDFITNWSAFNSWVARLIQ